MNDLKGRLMRLLRLRLWLAERFQPTEWQITLLWAAVVGVLGALGSHAFKLAAEGVHQFLTGSNAGVVETFRLMPWWMRLAVPALGGALAGATLLLGQRLVKGRSSTDYMEAIVIGGGHVPVRASLMKIVAALFSIGSGGSIGREGPMVQLAAVLASRLGRWRSFPPPRLRLLVACGAAAGITSAYHAPMAGAFFVAEILLGSIAMDCLGPLAAASVAAVLTTRAVSSAHVLYEVPPFTLGSAWEMGPYLVLGLLSGTLAPWFLRSLRGTEAWFAARAWPAMLRLAVGGLIVGALAIRVPEVCGNGYSVVLDIVNGRIVWSALLLILACKWLATAASFGSGAPGGVFTPSLFMGASAGYLFGFALQPWWPLGGIDPLAFALVGMGAFLSAATHAPVMSVIMLFEMTLSYDIILPLAACSVVAYFTAKGLEGGSLYSATLKRKSGEVAPEPAAVQVRQLMKADPPTVRDTTAFPEIARLFLVVRVNNLYVVDEAGRFGGMVSLHDIKSYLNEPELGALTLAGDIAHRRVPTVRPGHALEEALTCFRGVAAERLPVVEEDGRLAGSLAKTDILLALSERLRARKPEPERAA